MSVMITGGFGFIGNHVTEHFFEKYQDVVVVDALTYASNNAYLKERLGTRYNKLHRAIVDIRDVSTVKRVIKFYKPKYILNLAAESHVCNSITNPAVFYQTNAMGTFNLLESVRELKFDTTFLHVSTDEVFGDLGLGTTERFHEDTPYAPTSPYAASKACADMIVRAHGHTYGMKTLITNCTNNFGPNQHEEKLIPKVIKRILTKDVITIYGTGQQIRDWLWVKDHAKAIDTVLMKGTHGETYCIGGDDERTNASVIHAIVDAVNRATGKDWQPNIQHTNGRPTDDQRYAIDCSKLKQLGWKPTKDFQNKLLETVHWYLERQDRL